MSTHEILGTDPYRERASIAFGVPYNQYSKHHMSCTLTETGTSLPRAVLLTELHRLNQPTRTNDSL